MEGQVDVVVAAIKNPTTPTTPTNNENQINRTQSMKKLKNSLDHSLSKEHEQELSAMFQMYAKENKVTLKDMHSLIRSNIGVVMDIEELMDLVQFFSPESMVEALNNESNERRVEKIKVDFPTFIKCINTRFLDEKKLTKEEIGDLYLKEIFNLLDANQSGTIGKAEVSHFFSRTLGENLVEDQIIEMCNLVNNSVGFQTITFEEFKLFVKEKLKIKL